MSLRWDIFCRVVDNYGDIGVCWRLARQLATEHAASVRLWVDDLGSFARLCPQLDPAAAQQMLAGIDVRHWGADVAVNEVGEVVIEAFACELPASALAAMRTRSTPPVWINLEYLSAEDWVEGCHQLASPQAGGLKKHFFFPGFSAATGGLLGERAMRAARAAWTEADAVQHLQAYGALPEGALRVSLFAYENAAIARLLDAWAYGSRDVMCYLPEGRLLPQVAAWAGRALAAGNMVQQGRLALHVLPLLDQDGYDRLLWSCHVNFVRGEDSFVRAQWAARPMVWHIYRQEEGAHLIKLEAFLARYGAGPASDALMQAWNDEADVALAWQAALASLPQLQAHAERWAQQQASHNDLAGNLVSFVKTLLK
ncbi:hypothetical protein IGB42_02421 [Andreprevotia sp. IGB-42]|uniref:elongation factor P maturation arginine rhamnosyltransferase EarP n=1 Tax=Andreprevotia sp. IGB-42 TaxID=2497473 RepID=UPI00135B1E0F|nr:elongation factor P maturation arginine rhamnosyltransferase EarP [Andreprevotia sp. IGB-42]KAF0813025.1 hypothetical protein IGB42_02421 [Andreprevotia sp. IGB-42]